MKKANCSRAREEATHGEVRPCGPSPGSLGIQRNVEPGPTTPEPVVSTAAPAVYVTAVLSGPNLTHYHLRRCSANPRISLSSLRRRPAALRSCHRGAREPEDTGDLEELPERRFHQQPIRSREARTEPQAAPVWQRTCVGPGRPGHGVSGRGGPVTTARGSRARGGSYVCTPCPVQPRARGGPPARRRGPSNQQPTPPPWHSA